MSIRVLFPIFAIGLIASLPFIGLGGLEPLHAHPQPIMSERTLSTVSLNLAKESSSTTVVRAIRQAPRLRQADLFLFQEVRHTDGKPSVAEDAAHQLGYSAAFQAAPGFVDQGVAIVSRYPLSDVRITDLKPCDLRFRSRKRLSIGATARTPWGDVRVWNVHLDTRINAGERLEQLEPVLNEASRYQGPKLIGGDFNTNDLYWVGNVVPLPFGPRHGAAIRTSLRQRGFETPLAQDVTYPLFQRHLDWIYIHEMKAVDASIEPAAFSDHHAIWVHTRL